MINKQETHLKEWQGQEEAAEQMLPLVGQLYRERNIVSTVYGRSLVHSTTIDILKAHRFARLILEEELSIHKTLPVIEALSQLDWLRPGLISANWPLALQNSRPSAASPSTSVMSWPASIPAAATCLTNPRILYCTVSAGSAACWPAC